MVRIGAFGEIVDHYILPFNMLYWAVRELLIMVTLAEETYWHVKMETNCVSHIEFLFVLNFII